jgi:hypothetical protein
MVLALLLVSKVPKTYPPVARALPPPAPGHQQGGGLDGFESPYLGHTGSWDGRGGAMFGHSKIPDLDKERGMGLRWTFMPVHWSAMEPVGPVDLAREVPPAWQELDGFVMAAHDRGLNILMQAPVIGGNAGGPPNWAGTREPGKSAPANMEAAANFAAKLAYRYCPGGTLAKNQGWKDRFGIRAWEMDNEPEGYRTCWKEQSADYAEFVTKAAAAIKKVDAQALILTPAMGGGGGLDWLQGALDPNRRMGSPVFRQNGVPYSIGRPTDVVSFHCYEGLETGFSGKDRTVERDFSDVRAVFETREGKAPGFEYAPKTDYWHTEGNFDFFGVLSAERRAAWRFQFLTRGFAAGIRKLMIMDASPPEQAAVRAYIGVLPNPFPMVPATTNEISTLAGHVAAFMHTDGPETDSGRVWVLWALAGTGDAHVKIPVLRQRIHAVRVDGTSEFLTPSEGHAHVKLKGDKKMAPGILLVDRPGDRG